MDHGRWLVSIVGRTPDTIIGYRVIRGGYFRTESGQLEVQAFMNFSFALVRARVRLPIARTLAHRPLALSRVLLPQNQQASRRFKYLN